MEIVTFSSLYPNCIDPTHGVFVERRLVRLIKHLGVSASVVAPVPWFPFQSEWFGRYGKCAAVPKRESREGVDIYHPRHPVIPKIGMMRAPKDMARFTEKAVRRLVERAQCPVVLDAHYFYPDGVAASILARNLGIPFIVTARGSDVNQIARMSGPDEMVRQAASEAEGIVSVSQALARTMVDIGIDRERIHVLPNGVDLQQFHPGNRESVRNDLGFKCPTIVSVGALKKAKGHHIAIESLEYTDDANLVVVGGGVFANELKSLVRRLRLESRVSFTGSIEPQEVLKYYQGADCLMLASEREGMPNVVLEAIACGTPVIASNVGGIGEVINQPYLGELLNDRTPTAFAAAWTRLQAAGIDRDRIRQSANAYSWDSTIAGLGDLLRSCAN